MTAASTALSLVKPSGRGRPPSSELLKKREETKAALERMGLFKAAKDKRSKAFDSWGIKDCEAALKWARKRVQENGGTLDELDDAPGSTPAGKVVSDVATPPQETGPEIVKACGRVKDPYPPQTSEHLDAAFWVSPYHFEAVAWAEVFRLRDKVDELEQELSEAFGDIQRLTCDHEYKASLKDILVVAGIDKGRLVRDIRRKLQVIITDAVDRDDTAYKGKVKATMKVSFDKTKSPTEALAANITCEVAEDTPPALSGSKLYFDAKGNIIPPKEYANQMPLMAAQ